MYISRPRHMFLRNSWLYFQKRIIMITIEVHGYENQTQNHWHKEFIRLFSRYAFAKDIVVTIFSSRPFDLNNEKRPYLKVWGTEKKETIEAKNILNENGYLVVRDSSLAEVIEKPLMTTEEVINDLLQMKNGGETSQIVDGLDKHTIEAIAGDLDQYDLARALLFYKMSTIKLPESVFDETSRPNQNERKQKLETYIGTLFDVIENKGLSDQ